MENIHKLQKHIKEKELYIVENPISTYYLLNTNIDYGKLVVFKDNYLFFTDFRYFGICSGNNVKYKDIKDFRDYVKSFWDFKIFLETDYISGDSYLNYREIFKTTYKIGDKIKKLRQIKDEEDINSIKEAQEITDKSFKEILDYIKEKVDNNIFPTEKEIARNLESIMLLKGSEKPAFDTICASGKNSAIPHAVPSDKKIKPGEFLTLDFGATVNGYKSDMTRTIAIKSASDKMVEVYNLVLSAQKFALESIKEGKTGKDIDSISRDLIEEKYENTFNHALGHSLGLEIHENPNLSPRSVDILKENMLMTVEPGIYLENEFGVRIEDLVVITKNGHINLTKSPKNLITL